MCDSHVRVLTRPAAGQPDHGWTQVESDTTASLPRKAFIRGPDPHSASRIFRPRRRQRDEPSPDARSKHRRGCPHCWPSTRLRSCRIRRQGQRTCSPNQTRQVSTQVPCVRQAGARSNRRRTRLPRWGRPIARSRDARGPYRERIHYSTGRRVRASDFRRALERLFRGGSPGAEYYRGVLGAERCAADPPRCTLTRGVATNDAARTVTFRLTSPDPDFPFRLAALNYRAPIPPGTPVQAPG